MKLNILGKKGRKILRFGLVKKIVRFDVRVITESGDLAQCRALNQ